MAGVGILFFSSLFHEQILSKALMVGVILLEGLCKMLLPKQSVWNLLGYVNFLTYLMPEDYVTYYANWGWGSLLVNRWWMMAVGYVLILGVLTIAMLLIWERKRPCGNDGKLEKWASHMMEKFHNWMADGRAARKERYRQYVLNKGGILLVAIGAFAWFNSQTDNVSYTAGERLYREFCMAHSGYVKEETLTAVQELREEVAQIDEQWEEARSGVEDGNVSKEEFAKLFNVMMGTEGMRTEMAFVEENLSYLERLEQEKGIQGGILDQRGYGHLFGEEGKKRDARNLAALFLFLLFTSYKNFSEEKETLLYTLFRSIGNGCKNTYRLKSRIGIELAGLAFLLVYGITLGRAVAVFDLSESYLPIQSVYGMDGIPISISIGIYGLLFLVKRVLLVLSAYEVVKGNSILLGNSWKSFAVSGFLLAGICVIGINWCWPLLIAAGILYHLFAKKSWIADNI